MRAVLASDRRRCDKRYLQKYRQVFSERRWGRVLLILTACSPTISMAGSGGAATSSTYRDTVKYSAILAGRVGTYYPYRLYAYCYAPGVGLPPYRESNCPGDSSIQSKAKPP